MTKLNDQAMKFVLSVFEQSGAQLNPELSELIDLAFAGHDSQIVMQAALEAMKQAKGRMTIAEIQKHVDVLSPKTADEHPSAEEAWALIPKSEDETTHLTDEMRDALSRGKIADYLERQDFIGGERTFKKLYDENVAKSRALGRKASWQLSLGHDKSLRVVGLERAVAKGIVPSDRAIEVDPTNEAIYLSAEKQFILRLPVERRTALNGRVEFLQQTIKQLADAKDNNNANQTNDWQPEYEPSVERLNDPYTIKRAASLGLSAYEYLVRPCTPHVAAKVHAQLSKQYGIDLSQMLKTR